MKTKIVKIGNSKGIRIPRHILEESGLKDEVELEVSDNKIILKSASTLRENWEEEFKRMSQNQDDILLDKDSLENINSWDNKKGEW